MIDIPSLLPPEARKHYMNLRTMRDDREIQSYQRELVELSSQIAAQGNVRSGSFMKQVSDLQKSFVDSTVYGIIEDALAVCDLYDVPLTPELSKSLEEVARQSLTAKYSHGPHLPPNDWDWPAGALRQLEEEWRRDRHRSMPKILVMIEMARVADDRKRVQAMASKLPKQYAVGTKVRVRTPGIDGVVTQMDEQRTALSEYWHRIVTAMGERHEPGCNLELIPEPITHSKPQSTTTYIQNVTQTGTGNSVSQFGNIYANIVHIGDMNELKHELAAIRSALKALPESLETDEVLGTIATAEKAAQGNDEHAIRSALGKITKGGWDIVKNVAPTVGSQLLLHYFKAHGFA